MLRPYAPSSRASGPGEAFGAVLTPRVLRPYVMDLINNVNAASAAAALFASRSPVNW